MEFSCQYCGKKLWMTRNNVVVVCTCPGWFHAEAARREVKPTPARNKKKSDYR